MCGTGSAATSCKRKSISGPTSPGSAARITPDSPATACVTRSATRLLGPTPLAYHRPSPATLTSTTARSPVSPKASGHPGAGGPGDKVRSALHEGSHGPVGSAGVMA